MTLAQMYERMRAKRVALRAMGLLDPDGPKYSQRRYMEQTAWFEPAVYWDKERKGIAYLPVGLRSGGLRFVGIVAAGRGGRDDWYTGHTHQRGHTGWYTRDDGTTFRDGDGLVWGVVYQLPGRKGMSRYVAGYQFGGDEGGPVLDLGTIFECKVTGGPAWNAAAHETEGAKDASNLADRMASDAADNEREYQRKHDASLEEEEVA